MTIDSLFYLVLIFLGGGLMIYGMKSKLGILNILSMPVWIFLAIEWQGQALLSFTMIGLALTQVLYIIKTL